MSKLPPLPSQYIKKSEYLQKCQGIKDEKRCATLKVGAIREYATKCDVPVKYNVGGKRRTLNREETCKDMAKKYREEETKDVASFFSIKGSPFATNIIFDWDITFCGILPNCTN